MIGVGLCLDYGYFEYYMNIVVACTIIMLLKLMLLCLNHELVQKRIPHAYVVLLLARVA